MLMIPWRVQVTQVCVYVPAESILFILFLPRMTRASGWQVTCVTAGGFQLYNFPQSLRGSSSALLCSGEALGVVP